MEILTPGGIFNNPKDLYWVAYFEDVSYIFFTLLNTNEVKFEFVTLEWSKAKNNSFKT